MRTRVMVAIAMTLAAGLVEPAVVAGAGAQGGGAPPRPARAEQHMGGGNKQPLPPNDPPRARLEQQIRQRVGQRMRDALGLTDAQLTKLTELNRRYEEKHRVLQDQERDVRMSLREEVLRSDSTRGSQMTALLDRYIKNERQRVDLAEQEQKELSAFLSPLQRAKYFGVQESIRNQIQNLREQGPRQGGAQGRVPGRGRMGPPNGPPNGPPSL